MTGLMSLGVKGPDVAALVMNGAPNTSDWSVPRIILRTIFSYWDIQINPKEFVLHALNFFYYILQVVRRQGTNNWKAFPIQFLNCLFNCCFRLLLCLLFKVIKLFYCVSGCFFVLFCSVVVLGCPFGLRVRPSYHRETTRQPYPPCPPLTTSPISVTTHSSWTAWLSPSSVMDSTHRPWLCFRG